MEIYKYFLLENVIKGYFDILHFLLLNNYLKKETFRIITCSCIYKAVSVYFVYNFWVKTRKRKCRYSHLIIIIFVMDCRNTAIWLANRKIQSGLHQGLLLSAIVNFSKKREKIRSWGRGWFSLSFAPKVSRVFCLHESLLYIYSLYHLYVNLYRINNSFIH